MNAPLKSTFNAPWGAGPSTRRKLSEAELSQRHETREKARLLRIQQTSSEVMRDKPPVTLPSVWGIEYEFDIEENALRVDGELQERLMKG